MANFEISFRIQPGGPSRANLFVMKTRFLFLFVPAIALALAGCATDTTTTTTQAQTDQTTTRVHTQDELKKSGESQTGPALEKSDAAIRTSGNR
jgi:hypothetical protein